MAYIKSYNYVDGNILNGSDQNANDDGVKVYVNQGAVSGDLATNT